MVVSVPLHSCTRDFILMKKRKRNLCGLLSMCFHDLRQDLARPPGNQSLMDESVSTHSCDGYFPECWEGFSEHAVLKMNFDTSGGTVSSNVVQGTAKYSA